MNKQPAPVDVVPDLPAIELMVIEGARQTMSAVFNVELGQVLLLSTTDRMAKAAWYNRVTSGADKLKLPLLTFAMTSATSGVEANKHGLNSKTLARRGVYMRMDDTQTKILNVKLIPTAFELEVTFITDSFAESLKFVANWMAASMKNRMNFTLTYGNVGLDIRTEVDPSLPTPPREESVDQPNMYEYVGRMTVAGYMSDHHVDGKSLIELIHKPVINITIDNLPGPDPRVYSPQHRMPIKDDP